MSSTDPSTEIQGKIFNIQRFSVHDGPGIRTTVFLHGCPLRCLWCHNPEALSPFGSILFDRKRCIACKNCLNVCKVDALALNQGKIELDRQVCTLCGACATVCPSGALTQVGYKMTAKELFEIVLKDRIYYQDSGGGLTISGGDPLLQVSFVQVQLHLAKEAGIRTAIDTCGHGTQESLESLLSDTDLFLFDLKHWDPVEHERLTGVRNDKIIESRRYLSDCAEEICIRIPVIPGCNDDPEVFRGMAELISGLDHISRVELLPYHPLGTAKYEQLGLENHLPGVQMPARVYLEELACILKEQWYGRVEVRT